MASVGYRVLTRLRPRDRWLSFALLAFLVAMAPATAVAQSGAPSETPALRYVALGDSWPQGGHCGGCRTFVGLWADAIKVATGRDVALTDLTGSQEPGLTGASGETSTSLLTSLRFNPAMRQAIRSADIILIANGPNDLELIDSPPAGGDCAGEALADCIDALGRHWAVNLDAAADEIALLRAGKPTAIRFVNAANVFLADPANTGASQQEIANGDRISQLLTDAMCGAAASHGGMCVDVRPIVNGPTMHVPGDENASGTMHGVADALLATGLPELE